MLLPIKFLPGCLEVVGVRSEVYGCNVPRVGFIEGPDLFHRCLFDKLVIDMYINFEFTGIYTQYFPRHTLRSTYLLGRRNYQR